MPKSSDIVKERVEEIMNEAFVYLTNNGDETAIFKRHLLEVEQVLNAEWPKNQDKIYILKHEEKQHIAWQIKGHLEHLMSLSRLIRN
jgi:hypothetical protein